MQAPALLILERQREELWQQEGKTRPYPVLAIPVHPAERLGKPDHLDPLSEQHHPRWKRNSSSRTCAATDGEPLSLSPNLNLRQNNFPCSMGHPLVSLKQLLLPALEAET